MSVIMQGILGCFIGCVILIIFHVALYRYQGAQFKKEMAELERKPSADRKHDSSKPDKTLANMHNVFSELQKKSQRHNEAKTDPNEPEFGKGWFAFVVQRDFAEINRQIEQSHNDKAG